MVLWFLMVLGQSLAGPTVPRAELEVVPEAWWATLEPLEAAVRGAREERLRGSSESDAASKVWQARRYALASATAAVADAEKSLKKSKSEPSAGRTAAEALSRATSVRAEADKAEATARGVFHVAGARHALAVAEEELAVASLEQAKAQAVADSGGWVETSRFDAAVQDALVRRAALAAEVERAKARAALWAQGG